MNSMNIEVCASAIEGITSALDTMADAISNLEDTSAAISNSWTSDNATTFTNKVNGIIGKLNELKTNIVSINAAVNETKNQIKSVDAKVNG